MNPENSAPYRTLLAYAPNGQYHIRGGEEDGVIPHSKRAIIPRRPPK